MPFEVGDWVIVHKPDDPDKRPGWINEMDEYDGKTMKIRTVDSNIVELYGIPFSFSVDWIEYPLWVRILRSQREFEIQGLEDLDGVEPDMSELM